MTINRDEFNRVKDALETLYWFTIWMTGRDGWENFDAFVKRWPEVREAVTDALKGTPRTSAQDARETVAAWMKSNGYATGHGDTLNDLLGELTWQIKEERSIRISGNPRHDEHAEEIEHAHARADAASHEHWKRT